MKRLVRKRRTREHIIADLSANHLERHVLLAGFVAERMPVDYGIDLSIIAFNAEGDFEEGNIWVQLKASDNPQVRNGAIGVRIQRADLVVWLKQVMPVILILYDARVDLAFWIYVQRFFEEQDEFNIFLAGKTITVPIPLSNVLNVDSVKAFRLFLRRVLAQTKMVKNAES